MKSVFMLAVSACWLYSSFAAAETLDSYSGQVLTVVTHKLPNMFASTSGRNAPRLGAVSPGLEGKKLVEENQIPDPTLAVATRLAPVIAARSKASNTVSFGDVDPLATGDVAKLVNGKGPILEIWTFMWGFRRVSTDFEHYVVRYEAMARILDPAGNPLAGAHCAIVSKDVLAYDDLTADHAAGLKSQFAADASTCADALAGALLAPSAKADAASKAEQ